MIRTLPSKKCEIEARLQKEKVGWKNSPNSGLKTPKPISPFTLRATTIKNSPFWYSNPPTHWRAFKHKERMRCAAASAQVATHCYWTLCRDCAKTPARGDESS